jgi:hypothetical protein
VCFDLEDVSLLRCLRHSALDDAVNASAYVTAKINARLLRSGVSHHASRRAEVSDDRLFLPLPSPEKTLDAAGKSRRICPPEPEPNLPLARATDN